MNRIHYWYWLCNINGIGRKTICKLLDKFSEPENIYKVSCKQVEGVLTKKQFEKFLDSKKQDDIYKSYEKIEKAAVKFIYSEDEEYPSKLKHLFDYPYGIYVKGKLPDKNNKSVSIIGSRKGSIYGNEIAEKYAGELVKRNVNVISGLAYGIDTSAHRGALNNNGYTLGVLGNGINICYPKENLSIYLQMEKKGGIMSEYNINVNPSPGMFPLRNRLISAMSDIIIVVEAKKKSGSLITVDQGLELGREVMVIPGRVSDELSVGCNELIKNGANIITNIKDVYDALHIIYEENMNKKENILNELAYNEKIVYSCLSLDAKHIDCIINETKLPVSELLSILFSLELKGYIKQIIKGYYIKPYDIK